MSLSTKDRIKEVALGLFAWRGYEATTMDEIAKGVQIKTSSLYSHFTGKEDLFNSIYEDLAEEYLVLMENIIHSSSNMEPKEALYYICEQYIDYYIENLDKESFWNRLRLFTPPHFVGRFNDDWTNYNNPIQDELAKIFEAGVEQGLICKKDSRKMVLSFLAYRDGLLYLMKTTREIQKDQLRYFLDIFWDGLKVP